jgi:hypothetical protein
MKTRLKMQDVYEITANALKRSSDSLPSHCTVRCMINDILDAYEREGYTVNHGYSQDKAFKEVRKLLSA